MINILKKRRSIRKFKDKEIPRLKVEELIKATLMSPSSRHIYPLEFIIVNDKDSLEKLSQCRQNGSLFLKNAPLGIVVLADHTRSDVWVEDASIASTIIQLTAVSIGLGSCWIQIRNRMYDDIQTAEEYLKNVLDIPENRKIESIIALGYPDEEKKEHNVNNLKYEVVYENKYNEQYIMSTRSEEDKT